jgi:xylobiose transport system substrate-binding protein
MNKRSWFRRAIAGGAVVAVAVALAGCSTSSSNSANSNRPAGVIHIAMYGDQGNKVEEQIVKTFNKTSKIKAVLDITPGANYQAKLQTIISTKAAPDIFFNWGGGSISQYVKAGLLMPLTDFIKNDPKLKSMFLPSVYNTAVIDGKPYGIPMRGTQPVMLFNNKSVLQQNGITAPKTWNDLLSDVKTLKAKGLTPIAIGGGDQWPQLMWYEYLYDRVAGPGLFEKALSGDKSAWSSSASEKALGMLRQLVDAGAFGTNYDSVKFTDGGSPKLLRTGQAAFELQGSWYFSTQLSADKAWTESDLGWSAFPTVAGGKGNQADVAGNTNNFYSVLKNTRYPQAVESFLKLMYSPEFIKAQLAIGNLPTTTNTEQYLGTAQNSNYLKYQFNLVKNAKSFQLSWDQAYPPTATTAMHNAVQQFFNGSLSQQQFITAMQGLPNK